MCSGVKKVFDAVKKLVKKIWDVVRKYLVYIVILVAVFYPYLWTMVKGYLSPVWAAWLEPAVTSIWGTTTFKAMALRGVVALGIGFLIDKETTAEVVGKLADAAGDVAESVVDIVGEAGGGALSAFISSPLGVAVAAAAIWFFFLRDKEEVYVPVPTREAEGQAELGPSGRLPARGV